MSIVDDSMVTLSDLVDIPVTWVCILFLFCLFFLLAAYFKIND